MKTLQDGGKGRSRDVDREERPHHVHVDLLKFRGCVEDGAKDGEEVEACVVCFRIRRFLELEKVDSSLAEPAEIES